MFNTTGKRAAMSRRLPDAKPRFEPTTARPMGTPDELDGQADEGNHSAEAAPALGCSEQLEVIMGRLSGDMSELAAVQLLPEAKVLYETLHPQSKHGGSRQVAKSATCPSFASYVAARTGLSKRTIYNRLETAKKLASLDPAAAASCFRTPLANRLGVLVRIAAVPKPKLHRDLVVLFDRSWRRAMKELAAWELEFGVGPRKSASSDSDSTAAETVDGGSSSADPKREPKKAVPAKTTVPGVRVVEQTDALVTLYRAARQVVAEYDLHDRALPLVGEYICSSGVSLGEVRRFVALAASFSRLCREAKTVAKPSMARLKQGEEVATALNKMLADQRQTTTSS